MRKWRPEEGDGADRCKGQKRSLGSVRGVVVQGTVKLCICGHCGVLERSECYWYKLNGPADMGPILTLKLCAYMACHDNPAPVFLISAHHVLKISQLSVLVRKAGPSLIIAIGVHVTDPRNNNSTGET